MLNTLKTLIRRVDFYLRNEEYRAPSGHSTTRPFSDLFEGPPDPFRTRVYWSVRRWAHRIWDAPRDSYYAVKYAYQRVSRGWDDRAVWSIDWWLDDKMPAMLRKLKEDKHGIPGSMFEGLPTIPDEEWNYTDEAYEMAQARWDAILDKMIAAFEASRRIQNLTYKEELGPYPLRRPEGVRKEDWEKIKDDRFAASQLLRERDEKIFKEGMALFAEHYWSLWD
jgi:hypothetical protein